jgi:hypothetical protein
MLTIEFKVSFNQGINVRFITDEAAAAIASIDYRDDGMKDKRIYTAWGNKKDEERLFSGLSLLGNDGPAQASGVIGGRVDQDVPWEMAAGA